MSLLLTGFGCLIGLSMPRRDRAAPAPEVGTSGTRDRVRDPTLVGFRARCARRIVLIMTVPAALAGPDRPPVGVASPAVVAAAARTPRDRAVDALCFLLGIGFTALAFVDSSERNLAPVLTNVEAALGGLASLGLWLRRRWPVGLAVAVGVLSVFSVSASGVALITLFTVAVHRRAVVAWLVAAGYGLISLLTPYVRPDLTPPSWPQSVLGVVCVAAILGWGMLIRSRRQLARARTERAAAAQEHRIAQARQFERHRIAREMHDVLAHRLTLLSLHAGAVELWPDAPPDEIARAAGVIRDTAHGALEDLRGVIGVLRVGLVDTWPDGDGPERPQPTLVDLPPLIDESRRAGARVETQWGVGTLDAVPDAVGRTAYRIVQEGLTNARKHAPHAAVSVAVGGRAGDGLTVEVRNPWPVSDAGTMTAPGAGMGLIGLAERAELVGGRLEHGRSPAGDFRLWAWLPWPP
jgi:signal transduction histidine kinase